MNIKERYEMLASSTVNDSTIDDVRQLKIDCTKEMNFQYYYYCDLLLTDIFTEKDQVDEALNMAIKDLNNIDPSVYRSIYISFLDRIIYIYISKKNFKTAYRYLNIKREYLDNKNIDEVNRWYLESAYVFAELNSKNKALQSLQAIITNSTNSENDGMLSLVYSNMTKLYIDEGDVTNAKASLNKCLNYVFKTDDVEGKIYCDYLLAKLYVLENNYRYAIKAYNDLFKPMKNIPSEYLSIYLEYMNLLIDNGEVELASKLLSKEETEYKTTKDFTLKRDYLKTVLKLNCLKIKKSNFDYQAIIKMIDNLEEKIDAEDDVTISENNEDDKNSEIDIIIKKENDIIENLINMISNSLNNDNMRTTVIDYSKVMEKSCNIDEIQIVIFDKSPFAPILDLYNDYETIWSYQYKKDRCYERTHTFKQLSNTIYELTIKNQQVISFDLKNNNLNILDLISGKTFYELNYNYLLCMPIIYQDSLIGAALYISKTDDITLSRQMTIFNIANKLLESKLISLFMQNNLRSQKNILNCAINSMQEGLFYLNPNNCDLILTQQAKNFLQFDDIKISFKQLEEKINHDDWELIKDKKTHALEVGESYLISYHLNLSDETILIEEKGSPYISNDGNIDFYVCTLNKINYTSTEDLAIENLNGHNDFVKALNDVKEKAKTIEYKFSIFRIRINNLNSFDSIIKSEILKTIYLSAFSVFSEECYVDNDDVICLMEKTNDLRTIEKNISIVLKQLDKGIIVNEKLINFSTYTSLVRYPRDSFNVEDIIKFSNLILDNKKRVQMFSEDMYKSYIKKASISQIVKEQLKNNNVSLLLLDLIDCDNSQAYEIKYNIRGLTNREDVTDYLDDELRLQFETTMFDNLLEILDKYSENIYFHLSIKTVDYLLKNGYFKKKNNFSNLVLVINDYVEEQFNIIQNIKDLKIKIIINYHVAVNVGMLDLCNNLIYGIYVNTSIDSKQRELMFKIFNLYGYKILCNYQFTDYTNIIYRTDSIHEI